MAVLGQQIFVAGGNDGSSRLDSVEFLDVRMGKWQTACHMTSARDGVSLCSLVLTSLRLVESMTFLSQVGEIYNPVMTLGGCGLYADLQKRLPVWDHPP